jgi:hypothetical protein
MAIEGKQLYLGGEPITLIQNNKFVDVDPTFVSEGPTYQIRSDAYSNFVYLAIPGTDFGAGAVGFTQSDGAYSDISGDINTGVSSKTITPQISGSSFPGKVYESGSTNFSSDGYSTSLVSEDDAAIGRVANSDLPFGTNNFVIEAWVMPDEQLLGIVGTSPFHKPMLRSLDSSGTLYCDFTSDSTGGGTNNQSRSRMYLSGNNITSNGAVTYTLGNWFHYAFVRSGNVFRLFQNGTEIISNNFPATKAYTVPTSSPYDIWGFTFYDNNNENARWAMQDLRITIGSDRGYPGGFTPPSSIIEKVT